MKRLSNSQTRWTQSLVIALFAICCAMPVVALSAGHLGSRLIPEIELRHLGLTRAWFAQVRLNPARNHVERAVLSHDRLTVLTSAGIVQEFNAHTGATLWVAPIGNENYPSLGPAVNEQYVALVNGSTLYVLDRSDGRPVITRTVSGAPGAAPALGEKYVFVPLVNGRIDELLQDFKLELASRGLQLTSATHEDEAREKLRSRAERDVHARLLLDRIGAQLEIEIGDEEVAEQIGKLLTAAGQHREKLRERYSEPHVRDALRSDLRRARTLERLIDSAVVTEVEPRVD